jgi:hypothetical protein
VSTPFPELTTPVPSRAEVFPGYLEPLSPAVPSAPTAEIADLGCGPAIDGAVLAEAGHRVVGLCTCPRTRP